MSEEKKIIVDEDWKEEAQREKEMLAEAIEKQKQQERLPPQPASFALLVTSLATQAMIALGDLEHPVTHKHEANLPEAQFHIDLLDALSTKTKGNLTPDEARLLDGLLFDLRMRFVERAK